MEPFSKLLVLIVVVALLVAGYVALDTYRRAQIANKLIQTSEPFSNTTGNADVSVLVLGDSTAVGVGAATSSETVAAMLSKTVGATYVENRAVSGALSVDIAHQAAAAARARYDVILVQVGANDIIRFHKPIDASEALRPVFRELVGKSDVLLHLSAGNVGAAPFFPFFLRPFYHQLSLQYHDEFERLARELGSTYVNLYERPSSDPFVASPEKYLAADGLHPSSAGYRLWFEKVQRTLSLEDGALKE